MDGLERKSILRHKKHILVKYVVKYLKLILNLKLIALFMASFLVGSIYLKCLNNKYENLYSDFESGEVLGVVTSNPETKEYVTVYKIKIKNISNNNKYKNTSLYLNVNNQLEKLEYGDLISFKGEYIAPAKQRNYGGFNYKNYLKTLKIYGTVKCLSNKIEILEKDKVNIVRLKINKLRINIKEKAKELFEENEANLLIGILIGDTEQLDEGIKENFKNSSLLHLLAVSGMHINYIIIAVVYIINRISLSKRLGKIITITILIIFMILVGFSPSVMRATIMGVVIVLSKLLYRKVDIISSISFSALIILIINPFNIYNTGFLLSYGGTAGIIFLNSNISKLFGNVNNSIAECSSKKQVCIKKVVNYLKEALLITISAQIIILPIMARCFNTVSATFFLSNLIVSPIMGIITISGFIIIFISFVFLNLSKIFAIPLKVLIKFLILVADFFSNMTISKIYIITIPIVVIIMYYLLVFLLNYFIYLKTSKITKRERKILVLFSRARAIYKKVLVYFFIFILIFNIYSNVSRNFKVYFIDQTTPNMIQRISGIFQRNPLISMGI